MSPKAKIDLMIIGAQKAGTTSLNNYLNEHPEILGHPQTEFAFFRDDNMYSKGYGEEFDRHFTKGDSSVATRVVAKNVGIYNSRIALERLKQHNPDCKLILVVREPVARAYSSYSMEKFNGWLKRDFSELKQVIENEEHEDSLYRLFIDLGLYAKHLKTVYSIFPKTQVKVFRFDVLQDSPEVICEEIYRWLEVDARFKPKFIVYNQSRRPKIGLFSIFLASLQNDKNVIKRITKYILPYSIFSRLGNFIVEGMKSSKKEEPISDEMKQYLQSFFKPYNAELEALTGIKFNELLD